MSSSDNSTSSWNFGDEREDPIHRIHSYPAKFPAFITTKALRYAEQQGVNVRIVADVFCGCGTSAVEAKRNGKNFWGCDINPVASLIAQVKTHHYRDAVLARYFDAIKNEFSRTEPTPEDHARISDRIRYWFDERNIEDLIRLDQAIRRQTPAHGPHRKFFLCGFSNIEVVVNPRGERGDHSGNRHGSDIGLPERIPNHHHHLPYHRTGGRRADGLGIGNGYRHRAAIIARSS